MLSDASKALLADQLDSDLIDSLEVLTVFTTEELITSKPPAVTQTVYVIGTSVRNRLLQRKLQSNRDFLERTVFIETANIHSLVDIVNETQQGVVADGSQEIEHHESGSKKHDKSDEVEEEQEQAHEYSAESSIVEDRHEIAGTEETEEDLFNFNNIPRIPVNYLERRNLDIYTLGTSTSITALTSKEIREKVKAYFKMV